MQGWRLAVTAFDDLDPRRVNQPATQWATHDTPEELWRWVSDRCQPSRRTVVVAHNLGYDLRITQAISVLPTLGWSLSTMRLDGRQAWCQWSRGKATLCMVDSTSWLPAGLARLGDMMQLPKPPLPTDDDDRAVWEARCRRDVEIMRAAYLRVLGWMESADLGVWQKTGAGCAWSAWRHRFLECKVLAAQDDDQGERERRASWTGRCEAWQWGALSKGPFVELDMELAYATIAAQCKVPTKLLQELRNVTPEKLSKWATTSAVLAEVEVTTDLPLVPCDVGGYTVWPVGTFVTTLWSPELRLLFDHGCTVKPLRVWGYQQAYALQAWAEWIIPICRGVGDGADPIIRLMAKHWSRALIGRFGLRYRSWVPAGESAVSDVQVIPGYNAVTKETYRWLQVGHQVFAEGEPEDSPNAVPAIMAWIMSECRRRLWELMEAAGLDNVAYVDTDALILTRKGAQRLQDGGYEGSAVILRQKGSWRRLEVLGPRQLVLGGELRAAGVPKNAERTPDGVWEATVWRSLAESLKRGEASSVLLQRRPVRLRGTDRRRVHLEDGRTAPIVLTAPG